MAQTIKKPVKKHSTTYKHKTKRGYNLEIKDNVVYINGKKAPVGYKWYDGLSKATYRVNSNGEFEVTHIKGKPVVDDGEKHGSRRSALYYADVADIPIDQKLLEESPTTYVNAQNAKYMKDRAEQETPYFIPTYLPNVPTLHVTTGKQYKGIDIAANSLDSIAKYSEQTGIPLNEFLGITHENTYNKHTPGIILRNKEGFDREAQLGPAYERKVEGRLGYYPTQLFNNFSYYTNNPWQAIANTTMAQKKTQHVLTDDSSNKDMRWYRYVFPTPIKPYIGETGSHAMFDWETYNKNQDAVRDAIENQKMFETNPNPFINTADYYINNNYGMGSGYKKKAARFGDELLADPAVGGYMRSKGYIE